MVLDPILNKGLVGAGAMPVYRNTASSPDDPNNIDPNNVKKPFDWEKFGTGLSTFFKKGADVIDSLVGDNTNTNPNNLPSKPDDKKKSFWEVPMSTGVILIGLGVAASAFFIVRAIAKDKK